MNTTPSGHNEEAYRIAYLIAGYIRKTLTIQEHDELDRWVEASDENMRLFEELTDEKNIQENLQWMDRVQTEKEWEKLRQGLSFTPAKKSKKPVALWPYMMAASVVLIIAARFLLRPPGKDEVPMAKEIQQDVAPGGNRAQLAMGNGQVIDLQEADTGTIKDEGGIIIRKNAEGEIIYSGTATSVSMHTLRTPKGGQYQVQLPDGSRVWLNAASSLQFPSVFDGKERRVVLTGEAYFDIARNTQQPFYVTMPGGNEIRVLGTAFNVSTYADEGHHKVSLVEGSLELRSGNRKQLLAPMQQAVLLEDKIEVQRIQDVLSITGWKEGSFVFRDADIHTIMRQVERWYDAEVVFRTSSSEHFNATISRKEPVSRLLHYLELTGKIHFKIENKTIYVLP